MHVRALASNPPVVGELFKDYVAVQLTQVAPDNENPSIQAVQVVTLFVIEQVLHPFYLDLHSEQFVPSNAKPVLQELVSHFPDPAVVQESQLAVQA